MPPPSMGAMTSTRLDEIKVALADRYLIDREIESGGMATVYLARDLKHDRLVFNERGRAGAYLDSLAALHPSVTHGLQQVWRARILAVLGSPDGAIEALHAAMRQGWSGWFREEWGGLHEEPDLASPKSYPAFRRMLTPDQTNL